MEFLTGAMRIPISFSWLNKFVGIFSKAALTSIRLKGENYINTSD